MARSVSSTNRAGRRLSLGFFCSAPRPHDDVPRDGGSLGAAGPHVGGTLARRARSGGGGGVKASVSVWRMDGAWALGSAGPLDLLLKVHGLYYFIFVSENGPVYVLFKPMLWADCKLPKQIQRHFIPK